MDGILNFIKLTDLLTLNPVQKLFRIAGCLPMVSAKNEYHRLYDMSVFCFEFQENPKLLPLAVEIEKDG